MEQIAQKVAELTGGDPEIILEYLREQMLTYEEWSEPPLKGLKIILPLFKDPDTVITSALVSLRHLLVKVYKLEEQEAFERIRRSRDSNTEAG